ncbi:hypothetical protein [Pseudanabaena sp. FACHB-2040]|uniref:hypothetical protein n=1 Tax=Pseudanabaena sp. FACHB-2040 TaxID=2692859 RepID=UPI001685B053|nr:hypothetical protein [Pseudanabaena sp. FACHB-2040]MBD2261398.1 hypothetical protein [Pseudanabaena sp. FACHB-2040]
MTQVCVCDRCRVPATEETMSLTGWWHLVTESKKSRPAKPKGQPRLKADICQPCIEEMGLRTNLEPTRGELYLRWMKEHPGRSAIEGLRKTALADAYIEDTFCDRCEEICSEQYVRLESTWLTEAQEKVCIDLCPSCAAAVEMPVAPLESQALSV